jgi:hypothetical protein
MPDMKIDPSETDPEVFTVMMAVAAVKVEVVVDLMDLRRIDLL